MDTDHKFWYANYRQGRSLPIDMECLRIYLAVQDMSVFQFPEAQGIICYRNCNEHLRIANSRNLIEFYGG